MKQGAGANTLSTPFDADATIAGCPDYRQRKQLPDFPSNNLWLMFKAFAAARGMTMGDGVAAAMREYIDNHRNA